MGGGWKGGGTQSVKITVVLLAFWEHSVDVILKEKITFEKVCVVRVD